MATPEVLVLIWTYITTAFFFVCHELRCLFVIKDSRKCAEIEFFCTTLGRVYSQESVSDYRSLSPWQVGKIDWSLVRGAPNSYTRVLDDIVQFCELVMPWYLRLELGGLARKIYVLRCRDIDRGRERLRLLRNEAAKSNEQAAIDQHEHVRAIWEQIYFTLAPSTMYKVLVLIWTGFRFLFRILLLVAIIMVLYGVYSLFAK
ncbi:hypothetical protein HDE_13289 [Halotydeus destructor]|nr:hypothetical protein HDE_13289 [Halotydeus destructor]